MEFAVEWLHKQRNSVVSAVKLFSEYAYQTHVALSTVLEYCRVQWKLNDTSHVAFIS